MLGAACSEAGNDAGDATSGDQVETNDDSMSSDTPDAEVTTAALDEGAAALTQTLTDLLDSHVYLASIAVSTGLTAGLDSPEFEAAAATLDQNSQDLAGAIESVYGAEAGDAFLKLWRQHIGFFVDYTAGRATKDDAKADKALKALENYKKDFSEFLDTATGGELPADAASDALQMHVNSLIDAIDAAIAGDPKVFDNIYEAATGHMPMTATALAGAITAQFPDKFPGSVDDPGAVLQQTLTDLLDSHVYLASIAVSTGLTAGLDSPEFEAAAATLDQNSQDLAAAIESVYGAEAGDAFLKLWRQHIGFFVDYTAGRATKDDAKADKALKALENYKKDFSEFLDTATGGELPADAASEALQMHVDSLIDAIDAAIAGDPKVFEKIYEAATGHMPMTASALAGAITAQFPEKF
jgi:uncharacterized protein YutE (UPF0331/DUF86 family)